MNMDYIYAAIAGDIAGSIYETTYPDFVPDLETLLKDGHFTDDTILTMASIDGILHKDKIAFSMYWTFKKWARTYAHCGFSKNFTEHFIKEDEIERSHSSANGALMMLSPFLGTCYNHSLMEEAVRVSHDCHEAIFLATIYHSFMDTGTNHLINCRVSYDTLLKEKKFCIDSFETLDRAFTIENCATSFEDGIQKAISLGGDTDTQAVVVAPMLCKKFGLPDCVKELVNKKLTGEMLDLLKEAEEFSKAQSN